MTSKWIEALSGSLEQKKQYKQEKARIDSLPDPYGVAARALHRYFMYYGGITDGDTLVTMFAIWPTFGNAPPQMERRYTRSSATTRSSSPSRSRGPTTASSGSTRSALGSSRQSRTQKA